MKCLEVGEDATHMARISAVHAKGFAERGGEVRIVQLHFKVVDELEFVGLPRCGERSAEDLDEAADGARRIEADEVEELW